MKVLVTGATGFIGSNLCRALLAAGHQVRALRRPSSSLLAVEGLPLEFVVGDILHPQEIGEAIHGVEVVFHCAGQLGRWRDPVRMTATHLKGTRNVVQAAIQDEVRRLVYTSSVAALGIPDHPSSGQDGPFPLIDERHTWNAAPEIWPYGYAKHLAEGEVLRGVEAGLDAVIVNPSAAFGAGDVNRTSGAIIWQMASGLIPPLNPPGGLNAVAVDDVIDGHLAALVHGQTGERYILGGENLPIAGLLALIADVVGRAPPRRTAPLRILHGLAHLSGLLRRSFGLRRGVELLRLAGYHFYYDDRKARTELDLPEPRPIRAAIEQAYHWYRTHAGLRPLR